MTGGSAETQQADRLTPRAEAKASNERRLFCTALSGQDIRGAHRIAVHLADSKH